MDRFAWLVTALGFEVRNWILPLSFIYALWIALVIIMQPLKSRNVAR